MGRREDFRLITGHGRYTSDWNLPGQSHAVFLRSDRAHAEILRLDAARALAHPGVITVVTGKEVKEAGFEWLPNNVSSPGRGGQQLVKPHCPALANATIDALRPLAIRHLDMPFTAARIWHAIRQARTA